jgi:putative ABC transport system permease protein
MIADHFRMPWRFLRGSGARLGFTIVALACGVALVCAIDLVNRAVLRAFVEVIDTMAGRAALQVSAGEGGLFPEEVAATVAAVPGVELAVPVVSATAFTADESGELLTVHGVEITNEAAVRVYEARDAGGLEIDDPLTFLNHPDSVVLTRAFATRRGLAVGDQIVLMTPTGQRSFTVRALLEPEGVAHVYGGNLVVMDLFAAEAAFARAGFINRVDVVINPGTDVARVSEAIAASLPKGLHVEAPGQRKADLNEVMQSLQVMLQTMGFVGLVAAFLIAFSRLAAVFEGRAWQLGVLRAGGVRARTLWLELVKESVILGAAGVALGIPLGMGVGRLLLPVVATTTALNYKLIAPEADLAIRTSSVALSVALGFGAALLAAALPAWRAARVEVVETIRGRGVEQRGMSLRSMWFTRGVTVGCIAMAVAMQSATRSAAWGLLATGLIAAGTALAAQPLLRLVQLTLLPRLSRIVGPTSRFTTAMFAQSIRRAALTTAMLGVGLGSIVWLRTVAHSFEQSLTDALSRALQGDLVVTSSHIASGYLEAPVDDGLGAELTSVRGVAEVVGERLTDWHHAGGPIAIDAFDPPYFTSTRFGQWPLVGRRLPDIWEAVARGDAVLVSSSFALNLRAGVGDTVSIETPSGLVSLRIAGITVNFSSPRGTIVMSRELYRRLWRDPQVNRVFLRTSPGAGIAEVRATIAQTLGRKYGLRILSSGELLEYFTSQVRRAFAPVDVLAGLVLLVVLVGMADTLAASVLERTRELGVMRAVGIRGRQLRRMVVAEGLVLGTLGLILAVSAGLALGVLWVEETFPYLLGWVLEIHIPYGSVETVCAVTIAVCLVAALLPARRAARLEPAVALRYE